MSGLQAQAMASCGTGDINDDNSAQRKDVDGANGIARACHVGDVAYSWKQ